MERLLKMDKTIPIRFKLRQFQPDQRKFQTSKSVFEPVNDFVVVIEMPLERQYIYNVEHILMAQIAGNKHDAPEFTERGLAYIEDQLLSRVPIEGTAMVNNNQNLNQNSKEIEWEKE
jgi:hypothetical protein